ncbi:MAG: SUMF1/EgtB/PvdO family nonheme iron enzyme [Deltaproteobacteria bacterium]|nr:SUMF1/EgtB/PvdO family nonheme iron enzyme [Deltaproteobacteria bacterium]MBN2673780.1 SUMF1/EgtB/PvdO family nonheme iron enzyme [Deltaproteobacteria bacterium]
MKLFRIYPIVLCLCVWVTSCDWVPGGAVAHYAGIDSSRDSAFVADFATDGVSGETDSVSDSATETSTLGGCIGGSDEDTATAVDSDNTATGGTDTVFEDTGSGDSESDSEYTLSDTDDTESDTGSDKSICPADMVHVPAGTASLVDEGFCIDIYEASRADASTVSYGSDNSIAMSRPDVLPWYVNPMTTAHLQIFRDACTAAGKTLCSPSQWQASCSGPENTTYVFGNLFDVETCNNVATFCDDYCAENGIDEAFCNLSESNCGYYCGEGTFSNICYEIRPTGEFPQCTNELGTYDINGNLWEIVAEPDAATYEIRGGAINCASPSTRLRCDFQAGWTSLYAGFRCCRQL